MPTHYMINVNRKGGNCRKIAHFLSDSQYVSDIYFERGTYLKPFTLCVKHLNFTNKMALNYLKYFMTAHNFSSMIQGI